MKKRLAKNPEQHSERDFTLTGAQQHDLTRVTKARLMPQGRVQELLFPTGDPHLADVKKRLAKNPERHSEQDFTLTGAHQHDLTRVTKARLMPQGRVQ